MTVNGGDSVILHLDDWEHLDELSNDPVGKQNFIWGSPKSKNIDYKVEHPVFSKDKKGKPTISYIDQFPEPQNMVSPFTISADPPDVGAASKDVGLIVIHFFLSVLFTVAKALPA